MSEKSKLIAEMLEMQKKFIDFEQKNGVNMEDYYAAKEGHTLNNYREEYSKLADKVNALAHKEKGSKRFY
ncbi:MAG: hypothetical protein OQK73_03525 [Gammaproteobacteria bacterium]|nr:hypothetical protein [Gammaproteobacteria bacterium]